MRPPHLRGLAAAALLVLVLWPAGPAAQFASGVDLVEVYATVTGPGGGAITGLAAGDFEIREDGALQTIAVLTSSDVPLAVALAFDHSASMAGRRLELAREAARAFLRGLRPSDQAMMIRVANEVEVLTPLGTDRAGAAEALAALTPWSTTRLHDAIIRALDLIEPAGGRRALILLSDGVDRHSAATADEALDRARRADVLVYPVAISASRSALFPALAALTGGRSFQVDDPRQLESALVSIANELRTQYLIGYVPSRPAQPGSREWRSIEVTVARPGVRVRARNGYFTR